MTLPALPALPPVGAFAADDGSVDPFVAAVLADHAAGRADLHAVQRALLTARVLVPVVATATATERAPGGQMVEKVAQMATVTVTGRDGRRALPVFTSTAALAAWDPAARPFPTHAPSAAAGAYAEGAVALLVDFGGPHHVVLEGPPMLALAEGREWLPPAQDPEVYGAVHAALAGLPGLAGVDIGTSAEADLSLILHVDPLAAEHVREVAQEAAARLAGVDLLRTRLERGMDLAAGTLTADRPSRQVSSEAW